jgi:hypothetical protein
MPLNGEMRGEIQFAAQVPCSDETLASNVASALARGLPSTQVRKRLNVIANGPSAKSAPFGAFDGPTLALNGALRQFTERGLAPTYWAACDPQALVADFLTDPPQETIYLVASKCHPLVFDMLPDRDVRLWHVRDVEIPGQVRAPLCSSITMCSMWEMRQAFGFTDLHVWGWDGCYLDGEHHAGNERVPNATDVTIEFPGGRTFETTHSWAMEADFAQQLFQLFDYFDIGLTIHGNGMMAAMKEIALAK